MIEKFESALRKTVQVMCNEQGNIHTYKDFPHYLKELIQDKDNKREINMQENRARDNYWEDPERIESTTLSGVGIIDMRSKNELMNNSNREFFFKKE